MLSCPPAITIFASFNLIELNPKVIAANPEPQTWLIVVAVFSLSIPALIAACLAGFWPQPAWRTWPKKTVSTSVLLKELSACYIIWYVIWSTFFPA